MLHISGFFSSCHVFERCVEMQVQCFVSVREKIGPIATPDFIQNAPALPKTRSGNRRNSFECHRALPLRGNIGLLFPLLLSIQGRSWGGFSDRSPATRRSRVTFPPWPTQRSWRCYSARDVRLWLDMCDSTSEGHRSIRVNSWGMNPRAGITPLTQRCWNTLFWVSVWLVFR